MKYLRYLLASPFGLLALAFAIVAAIGLAAMTPIGIVVSAIAGLAYGIVNFTGLTAVFGSIGLGLLAMVCSFVGGIVVSAFGIAVAALLSVFTMWVARGTKGANKWMNDTTDWMNNRASVLKLNIKFKKA